MKKLLPHEVRGEGHFCAVLQKSEGERRVIKKREPLVKEKTLKLYREALFGCGALESQPAQKFKRRCLVHVNMPDFLLF